MLAQLAQAVRERRLSAVELARVHAPASANRKASDRDDVRVDGQVGERHRGACRDRAIQVAGDRTVGLLRERSAEPVRHRLQVFGRVDVLPPGRRREWHGLEGVDAGELGHGAREGGVTCRLRLPLRVEDRRGEEERAAVDRWVAELLRERNRALLVQAHPRSLGPSARIGSVVDEHRRVTGRKERLERALTEDVVSRDEEEAVFLGRVRLGRGQRRPVAELPAFGEDGSDAIRRDPVHDRGYRPCLVAHDHDDALDPSGQHGPDGPLHQAQAAQSNQGLRATPGHHGEPFRTSRSQHDGEPWAAEMDLRAGGPDRRPDGSVLGKRVGHRAPWIWSHLVGRAALMMSGRRPWRAGAQGQPV